MSNGIDVNGNRQTSIPLTGERIVAHLKTGRLIEGMYQDGRVYSETKEVYRFEEVARWSPKSKER